MLSLVNEFAVLVSALLALALGSIWYSPLVFGKHWQRAALLTDTDLALSRAALTRSLIVGFLSNVVVMYVIASFLRLTALNILSRGQLALMLIGFLGASILSVVVWEKKSLMYFLIHMGYGVLVVFVGIIVIALWPW